MRSFLIDTAYRLAQASGINAVVRARQTSNSLLILCYHSVVADRHWDDRFFYRNTVAAEDFQKQLEWIGKVFRPASLAELLDHLNGAKRLPRRSVVITFDDGYRNNLTIAAPILQKLGVPALVSVATDYIGTDRILWSDEVNRRVYFWPRPTLPMPDSESGIETAPMPATRQGREELASAVRRRAKKFDQTQRDRYLDTLRQEPCPALDGASKELLGFMTWEEVRQLTRRGIDVGSHSATHPILSRVLEARLDWELRASKERIEKELGRKCRAITYPNGGKDDVTEGVLTAAARAGYEVGFALNNRFADLRGNRLAIERINVPGQTPLAVFQCWASGLRSRLRL